MIAGDPNTFALCWNEVPSWSTASLQNGLLLVLMGGEMVGGQFYRATLGPELLRMRGVVEKIANADVILSASVCKIEVFRGFSREYCEGGEDAKSFHLISP
ncbi:Imm42 family immunity protein [Variovorax sp. J22G21]|nr:MULTISPECIES: Imm42 family immunity protein [unclassified Variovorax]MDM0040809.1 Imm42 family immunity protein [Variovorax sp. J22R193]MDM0064783.1 Imm42 family immunity protein [Variovorax sp. J22G21]